MGKKDGNKKKQRTEEPASAAYDIEADEELQAELEAVAAMRAEKARAGGDEDISEFTTYNKNGLLKHIDMSESVMLPFIETLLVDDFGITVDNENEDLEREMAFYNQTILAVKRGREQLEELGVPTRRPTDYFCENMKSDMHMTKIKDRLLLEDKRIEAFEMRKNRENNRKFNKQVSELKKMEKVKKTKGEISEVSKLRKSSESSNVKEERLNKVLNDDNGPEKSRKRINMDKKYGFGAKERKLGKMNDKKSLNDLSDFNPRGGQQIRRSGGAGGAGGGRGGGRGGGGRGGGRGGDRAGGRGGRGGGGGGRGGGGRGGASQRPGKDARAGKRKSSASS